MKGAVNQELGKEGMKGRTGERIKARMRPYLFRRYHYGAGKSCQFKLSVLLRSEQMCKKTTQWTLCALRE